ncbi:MAG: hypothetical protein ACRDNF_06805 [Streptosporangiaceae bacterium]
MLTTPDQPAPDGHTDPADPPGRNQSDDDAWDMPVLPGERAALEALRWNWGEAYHIGCDDGQWWFRRKDGKGPTETASTPDDLRAQIVLDYTLRPVHRAPPQDGEQPVIQPAQEPGE